MNAADLPDFAESRACHPHFLASGLSIAIVLAFSALLPAADSVPQANTGESVATTRSATMELNDVRDAVLANQSRLQSIKATVRSWRTETASRPNVAIVAAKDGCRYELQWHGGFRGVDDDPESSIRLYCGGSWNVFRPFERNYEVTKRFAAHPYSDKILRHFFFESLGWWPPGDSSPPLKRQGEPKFINEILADDRCRLLPMQELVGQDWCHVAEVPGVERLWIVTSSGIVSKRQTFILDGPEKGKTLAILHLRDFQQMAPGLLLPRFIERELVAAGQVTYHSVDDCHVNTIEDSQFTFSPPPGTIIYNRDSDTFHQVPGGVDMLHRITRRAIATTASTSPKHIARWKDLQICSVFLLSAFVSAVARRCFRPADR
jgi:hypothetical protein